MKVTRELQKIFNDNKIKISCTAVRIPTFRAHSASINIKTKKPIYLKSVYKILKNAP
jgi:aspartate-semialdehyde dehydrogenase